MKRLFILTLFALCIVTSAKPATTKIKHSQPWHEGLVVLYSGDTIECKLKFTRKVSEGLLQVMKGKRIEILTVKDVAAFSYFDEEKKIVRKFITLSLMPDLSTRKHEIFIEYVYGNDKLSILNYKTLGFAPNTLQINPFRKKSVVNVRYLLNNDTGKVLPMSRENALELMDSEKQDVLSFIQAKGLRLKTVDDFISLLDYHKTLF